MDNPKLPVMKKKKNYVFGGINVMYVFFIATITASD